MRLLIAALLLLAVPAFGEELDARAIAEKAADAGRAKALRQKTTMTLIDAKGGSRARTIAIASRRSGKDTETRIEFLEPKDVAGTVLLTVEKKGASTQHLYLPGIKRVRRVAVAQRSGAFMGSDFSFEDLEPRNLDGYDLVKLPDETVAGKLCHVIEAVPKKGTDSAYARSISYISQDELLTLRVRLFDAKKTEIKILEVDPERFERKGDTKIPGKMEMKTLKDGHRTVLETSAVEIDPVLQDSLFDPASLDRG